MYALTETHVKSCDACQRAKNSRTQHTPLRNLPVVGPFERWHIDYLGPLTKTKEGYQPVFLMIDSYSKFLEVVPMTSVETNLVHRQYSGR